MVMEIFEAILGPIAWVFQMLEANINTAAPAGILILGLLTGLKHSFEADHLAAVSTMAASSKRKLSKAPVLGALWGAGHTASLLIAGLVVLLFAVNIPEKVSETLEFGVGIMLVLLGVAALTSFNIGRFLRGGIAAGVGKWSSMLSYSKPQQGSSQSHRHPHTHLQRGLTSGKEIVFRHSHEHNHANAQHTHSHKSLIVGMIHGMAGSGAVMLIVLSTISSVPAGLAYIALFGVGSIAGMAGVSTAIGLSFRKLANLPKLTMALKYTAGLTTILIGSALIYELAIVEQALLPW